MKIPECMMKKKSATQEFVIGALIGSAVTALFFCAGKIKNAAKMKNPQSGCDCKNDGDDFCECGCDSDYERARNRCDCAEESDTDILHSHGCLGYSHDDYCGFADSNGGRPSDLSSPEIPNQKGKTEENSTPYNAKNSRGKGNPQPENAVNRVKPE
jgi:hypothetical protein